MTEKENKKYTKNKVYEDGRLPSILDDVKVGDLVEIVSDDDNKEVQFPPFRVGGYVITLGSMQREENGPHSLCIALSVFHPSMMEEISKAQKNWMPNNPPISTRDIEKYRVLS